MRFESSYSTESRLRNRCSGGGFVLGAVLTKDIVPGPTDLADKSTHILDESQDRNVHPSKHIQTLTGIDQCQILGGGNDHRPQPGGLAVPSLTGHLRCQAVNRRLKYPNPPLHIMQHLLQGFLNHRPPPNHRGFFIHQHPHRHHF